MLRFLIVALCVICSVAAEKSVPLFLWNTNSVKVPALDSVSQTDLTQILAPLLAENAIVVFMEENLRNKDFQCTNAATRDSCYARLQGIADKHFYASVNKPIETLQSIGTVHEDISIDDTGKLSKALQITKGKVVFITFKGEQTLARGESLEKHDVIMATLTKQLMDENVIFGYTSEPTSAVDVVHNRERRDTAATTKNTMFRDGSDLLVFFTSLSVSTGEKTQSIEVNSMSVSKNATALSVVLSATPSPLSFDIVYSSGYYYMKSVMWNNVQFRSSDVYAPTDFSYFCGNLTLYGDAPDGESSSYILNWNSLQFQAPFNTTSNKTFVFSDPWHCVGFFTGGILSGLLIVALLLSITFIGVCWMMDINTMDRFDDPKGKTITINASE